MKLHALALVLSASCLLGCPSKHKSGDGHDHSGSHKSHSASKDKTAKSGSAKSGEHKSGDGHKH